MNLANNAKPADAASASMSKRLIIFLQWAFWVGIAFFSVYPSINWLTSERIDLFHLYFPGELAVPFMPQFIWAYLSMYVLFMAPPVFLTSSELPRLGKQLISGTVVSGAIFILFPAILGFQRVVPDVYPYDVLFNAIFSLDHPHNLVPSLHVVYSACIILAIADRAMGWFYGVLMIWLGVIAISTVFVHQHHILDVVAGLALTIVLRKLHREAP